jgi:hypothetical protein
MAEQNGPPPRKPFDADAQGDRLCDLLRRELDKWPEDEVETALYFVSTIITNEYGYKKGKK